MGDFDRLMTAQQKHRDTIDDLTSVSEQFSACIQYKEHLLEDDHVISPHRHLPLEPLCHAH